MFRSPFEFRFIHIGDDQLGSVARQPLGDRKADASRGARDDGDVVFQFLVHTIPAFTE
jgi:hypothetical protein